MACGPLTGVCALPVVFLQDSAKMILKSHWGGFAHRLSQPATGCFTAERHAYLEKGGYGDGVHLSRKNRIEGS
ncbi:MAG: hypothetical protein AMS17_17270 [Spirochaetes bacterium DG_61]|nr:MAG: hypothetical protein AMS17_17270 [Spirochaetes bacterium DG_61]